MLTEAEVQIYIEEERGWDQLWEEDEVHDALAPCTADRGVCQDSNWHTVSARASAESEALPVGASVLLVDRDAKSFIAISAPADLVEQQHSSNRA